MPADYTAIVQHYYRNREKYLLSILESLQAQSIPPKEIIVWDNTNSLGPIAHVTVVSSSRNTLMGRYASVWMAQTDLILIQDNDLILGRDTAKQLVQTARSGHHRIVGMFGMDLKRDSEKPYADRKTAIGDCDLVLGRAFACHKRALLEGFNLIVRERLTPGRCDDILFSMASRHALGMVGQEYRDLDEEGIGLSHEAEHFAERDAFALQMMDFGY